MLASLAQLSLSLYLKKKGLLVDFEKLEEEIINLLFSVSTEKGKRLLNEELCMNITDEIIEVIKENITTQST